MQKFNFYRLLGLTLCVAGSLVSFTPAVQAECNSLNRQIKGRWRFSELFLTTGAGPMTEIGLKTFDGCGTVSGKSILSTQAPSGGLPANFATVEATFTGEYTVNADGTWDVTYLVDVPKLGLDDSVLEETCVLMSPNPQGVYNEFRCINTIPNGNVGLETGKRQTPGPLSK